MYGLHLVLMLGVSIRRRQHLPRDVQMEWEVEVLLFDLATIRLVNST